MEIGPRALGARSILASPCWPNMKDKINAEVKHREAYRPFAERDQAMLSAVADYASIALVNARLFQTMEARAHALQKQRDELVQIVRESGVHDQRGPVVSLRACGVERLA